MPAADATPARDRQRRRFLIVAGVAVLAFAVIAVLVRLHAGGDLDGRIVNWFAAHRLKALTDIANVFEYLGRWWVVAIAAALLVGVLWWSGRMVQAIYLGVTIGASLLVNIVLKLIFQRQPPGLYPVFKWYFYSFPSGHTMTATAIAAAFAVIAWPTRWRWPVLVVAALLSLGMATSRVYLGVHWPSDVAAGLALGVAVALAVRLLMPWPTSEEAEAAQAAEAATAASAAAAPIVRRPAPATGQGVDVVFLDWGNTLMVDNGMREGPMKDWDKVEAEAGAQVALRGLRARYRVVVATNAADSPASDVRAALARVGLDDLVDDVISSADVGDHKPHYAFYRAALLREGTAGVPLDPGRAVMVGDGTTNDIVGAQRAGLRTIWYNSTKRRFPDGAALPDATIRKLLDLPATVDRLAGVTPERRSRKQRKAEAAEAAAAEGAMTGAAATADLRAETTAENAAASAAAALPAPAELAPPAAVAQPASPVAQPSAALPHLTHPRVNLATRIVDVTPPQPPDDPATGR